MLEQGSIKRASQCLDQAELTEPTLPTMNKLAQLHPQADAPTVDVSDTVSVQITAQILQKFSKVFLEVQAQDHEVGLMSTSGQRVWETAGASKKHFNS
jgi:hypothetical protein